MADAIIANFIRLFTTIVSDALVGFTNTLRWSFIISILVGGLIGNGKKRLISVLSIIAVSFILMEMVLYEHLLVLGYRNTTAWSIAIALSIIIFVGVGSGIGYGVAHFAKRARRKELE